MPAWLGTVIVVVGGSLWGCGDDPVAPGDSGAGITSDAGGTAPADGGDSGEPAAAWSFVVLPDTQYLAESYPEIFEAQTRWIVEQHEALGIRFVLHVGDVVDEDVGAQWDNAFRALRRLDGLVPYVLTPGNHDYEGNAATRDTMLSAYFPVADFEARPSFGGVFEEGKIDNSYHLFDTPTGPWLVLGLEFGPRDAVVEWAGAVVAAHPGVRALIVTHAYLYSDDTRYDWNGRGPEQLWSPHSYGVASDPEGVNDAEEMWNAFIQASDDVDLVVSGHVLNDGLGRLESAQAGGGTVHQLLANYQQDPLGGAGFLRLMQVAADGRTVSVRTYSPYLDEDKTDPDNRFTLLLR